MKGAALINRAKPISKESRNLGFITERTLAMKKKKRENKRARERERERERGKKSEELKALAPASRDIATLCPIYTVN